MDALLPLGEWDSAYLDELEPQRESGELEKKAASPEFDLAGKAGRAKTKQMLAEQVCAFANAGGGSIVLGLNEFLAPAAVNSGVDALVGATNVERWAEEQIPKMHEPPIVGCTARFIRRPQFNNGRGALVVQVPLSERRPHWLKGDPERTYIRTGECSSPMLHRTFLDIATRRDSAEAEILEPMIFKGHESHEQWYDVPFKARIRLRSGPACSKWGFGIHLTGGATGPVCQIDAPDFGKLDFETSGRFFVGTEDLFPGRITFPAMGSTLKLRVPRLVFTDESECLAMSLYTDTAPPVFRSISVQLLYKQANAVNPFAV